MCKFQNVPCALGFEVKHSKCFCRSFRTCIIIISVLPKGRSFTASAGTKVTVLPKAGLPPQTKEPRLQFYQG